MYADKPAGVEMPKMRPRMEEPEGRGTATVCEVQESVLGDGWEEGDGGGAGVSGRAERWFHLGWGGMFTEVRV